MTKELQHAHVNNASIPVYVYVGETLVFHAISVAALHRIVGVSTTNLFVHIRNNTKLFNMFTISRKGTQVDTPIELV